MLFLWCAYLLFSLYSIRPGVPHSAYVIPEDAEIVVKVDGNKVFQDVLLGVFLEGKGDQLFQKIKTLSKKTTSQKQYGINWTQPVTYFKARHKGKELQGLIVQIINPVEWNKNINTLLGNTSVAKRQDNFGIVVQSNGLSKEELYEFIEQQKTGEKAGIKDADNKKFIIIHQKSDKGSVGLSISVDGNTISSNGIINHDGTWRSNHLNFVLTPSDFHLTSDLITQELRDTLTKFIGTDLSPAGISMNYRGVLLAEINKTTVPLPDADFVFGFERETSLQQVAASVPNAVWEQENKTVKIGKQVYFVKQLDEKTIYWGTDEHAELKENHQAIGLLINGSVKPLFNIEGSRWIRTVMRMNPALSFGMDLSEEVQLCSIRLEAVNQTAFQLTAFVEFKNEEDAVLKLLELVLKRQ